MFFPWFPSRFPGKSWALPHMFYLVKFWPLNLHHLSMFLCVFLNVSQLWTRLLLVLLPLLVVLSKIFSFAFTVSLFHFWPLSCFILTQFSSLNKFTVLKNCMLFSLLFLFHYMILHPFLIIIRQYLIIILTASFYLFSSQKTLKQFFQPLYLVWLVPLGFFLVLHSHPLSSSVLQPKLLVLWPSCIMIS